MTQTYKKNLSFFPVLAISLFFLSTCFTGYRGGTGTLFIGLGGNGAGGRYYVQPDEIASLEHEIVLTGPGGTITQKFTGSGTVSFELAAGNWDIKIRALGERPVEYSDFFPYDAHMLRALGWANVDISAGKSSTAKIDMLSATEVTNQEQLISVFGSGGFTVVDPELLPEEIIVIKNQLVLDYSATTINRRITIIAEKEDGIICRDTSFGDSFFNILDGGILKLKGIDGGRLILDGSFDTNLSDQLIQVQFGGVLEMYDNVIIQNNCLDIPIGGAVYINSGSFIMHGGTITANSAQCGGAVYMFETGVQPAIFIMKGGTISHNSAGNGGGGVYIDTGTFKMSGGTITGNTVLYGEGGGVFVNSNNLGIFIKEGGGTIYGEDAGEVLRNFAVSGKGHAVFATGRVVASVVEIPEKQRNFTAGPGVNMNSKEDSIW